MKKRLTRIAVATTTTIGVILLAYMVAKERINSVSDVVDGYLLPIFERWLIFHAPPAIFVRTTTTVVSALNAITSAASRSRDYPEIDRSVVRLVGCGIKSGCFVSTKLALEIGLHHGQTLVLDEFVHAFYDDPWSTSGNFEFANPPPPPTNLTRQHRNAIVHNGCQASHRILVQDDEVDVRCVWFQRDPLERLISFYTYTLDAGEYQLRNASTYVNILPLEQGVKWVFDTFARDVIDAQDETFATFYRPRYGCTNIFMRDLKHDFDGSVRKMLRALNVPDDDDELWQRLRRHDLGRYAGVHPHASRASKEIKSRVRLVIEQDDEMRSFVRKARARLGL